MNEKYLNILRENYPSRTDLVDELISLNAKLYLPKGTEYFFSDLHGEAKAFIHLLRSAAGNIRDKTRQYFGDTLVKKDQDDLANLIYNPQRELVRLKENNIIDDDWYTINIHRLVNLFRFVSTKYPKEIVKEKFPATYREIIDELLYTNDSEFNKKLYYEKIIEYIIKYESADDFIIVLSTLIQRISVDSLHIVGDIYDRGPSAHIIMDELISFPNVDIQWGNHDMEWMGACSGNKALVAACICSSISYNNFDFLEEGYGINLRPLYEFSMKTYRNDPCLRFMPKIFEENIYDKINKEVAAKMHKAMSVIRYKLDSQLLDRNPDFNMEDRNSLKFIDFSNMTYKGAKLLDTNFPTIDPKNPSKLSPEEEYIIDILQKEFSKNILLNKHINFMYTNGSMYKKSNGSLLFHGCIPMDKDGNFQEISIKGKSYKGRAMLDIFDKLARDAYFSKNPKEKLFAQDICWYLVCGKKSPIFGKSQYSYFENSLVDDKDLKYEEMNPYYDLNKEEKICNKILDEFNLKSERRRIINGHVPVRVKEGKKPVRANGKLYVIDGGISKPYQKKTGIAGYTLMYNSHHIALAEHLSYTNIRDNMGSYTPKIYETEKLIPRMLIKDTDEGEKIKIRIEVLKELLEVIDEGKKFK